MHKLIVFMPFLVIFMIKSFANNKLVSLLIALLISHKLLMEIVKLERKIIKILFDDSVQENPDKK